MLIRLLMLWLLATFFFMAVTVLLVYNSDQNSLREAKQESLRTAEEGKQLLKSHLRDVRSDLFFLRQHFEKNRQAHLENPHDGNREIANSFLYFIKQKRRYDQVRFIDDKGDEKLRINYNRGDAFIVPEKQLQSKSDRYYFTEAMALEHDEVYVSALDLNVENGEIEVPVKPVIRFAVAVHDRAGSKIGILVLSFLAGELLDDFRSIGRGFMGELLLLNSKGYFIVGYDRREEWGFMFSHDPRSLFFTRSPEIWNALNKTKYGMMQNSQGLFQFIRYNVQEEKEGGNYWYVVAHVDHEYTAAQREAMLEKLMPFIAGLYLLVLAGLWYLNFTMQRQKQSEEELNRLHHWVQNERDLFVGGPTVIFMLQNRFGWPVEYVSDNVAAVLGYRPELFYESGVTYSNIIVPEQLESFTTAILELKEGKGERIEHEPYQLVNNEGDTIWVRAYTSAVYDSSGLITHFYTYINDITELKLAQKKLEQTKEYIQKVINSIADPTLVIDVKNYEVVLMNQSARTLYGGDSIPMPSNMTCHKLSHHSDTPCEGKDDPCPIQMILDTKETARVVHRHLLLNGSSVYVELIATPIFDEKGEVVQIIESHRDITEQMQAQERLKYLADTDALTKTFNRQYFDHELSYRIEQNRKTGKAFGLIMFDIDHFKQINDTYGHDIGDSVLVSFVELIRSQIRESDTLARWGGEEFMLLVEGVGAERLYAIAEKIRLCIENHRFERVGQVTVSLGISTFAKNDVYETLVKRVDDALYQSKNDGRNRTSQLEL